MEQPATATSRRNRAAAATSASPSTAATLVRGATYAPDLFTADDPTGTGDPALRQGSRAEHAAPESKILSTRLVEMADEMGIPLMYGWMCCNQWERWPQWDDEDNRGGRDSLRSQIAGLRSHLGVRLGQRQ